MGKVKFKYPYNFGKRISIVGDFNNWRPTEDFSVGQKGGIITEIDLPQGRYYYKFLVDKQFWFNDPQAESYIHDGRQSINSVLSVDNEADLVTNKDYGKVTDISLTNQFDKKVLLAHKQIDRKNDFNCQDNQIYLYNTINNFIGEFELSYVWCTPDLKIYDAQSTLLQGLGGEQRTYHYINLKRTNLKPGQWKVFILANGRVIKKVNFLLKSNFYSQQNGEIVVR